MKKLSFLLIILSLSIIFSACPPLEEDYQNNQNNQNNQINTDSSVVISFEKSFELDAYKWFEILDDIAKEKKYVTLDLSKGTYKEGNEKDGGGGLNKVSIDGNEYYVFDPFSASSSGKEYILSIILPAAAHIIKYAVDDIGLVNINDEKIENAKKHSAFRSFTNLQSIQADNVTLIGNFAFVDCTALNEVIFPKVGHTVKVDELKGEIDYVIDIGKYAFQGCTSLKEVKFNSAAVIGEYAFKDCTSLSSLNFPEVWMIENNAFEGCISLANVFLEKASKIGNEAFKNCTSLKKAEFNVNPNRLFTPLDPNDPFPSGKIVYDSVIFYPSVFNGCKALEELNVRRAWNVYFDEDVFANTGDAVGIYLFDELEGSGDCVGHPQDKMFLGSGTLAVTLKTVDFYVPYVPSTGGNLWGNTFPENIVNYTKGKYPALNVNVNRRPL